MNTDSKTIAIWVLAIALIVVGALWISEMNKPDDVKTFNEELADVQMEVQAACADTTTDDKRSECIKALEQVRDLLSVFFAVDGNATTTPGGN